MHKMKNTLFLLLLFISQLNVFAQVGQHRSDFAIGVNGGYVLSNLAFVPKVSQTFHGGLTGGFSYRYICEKYFKSICSVYGEINYAQIGWKEQILDIHDQPVINAETGLKEEFQNTINYIQFPVFARLAWGRERKGVNFFFQAGPQFGLYLSEKAKSNFELEKRNRTDRVNPTIAQDSTMVQNKFDYGIAAGLGLEYSHPKLGHFLIEGRYYYGLGNIYHDSKRDDFSRSNFGNIIIKLTYLFDLFRTKDDKII